MKYSDEKPIIIYDGNCKLCQKAVQFLQMNQKKSSFSFVQSEDKRVEPFLAKYNINRSAIHRTLILESKGKIYMKSDAVIMSLKQKGGIWKIAGILLFLIPHRIRDAAYDWVAARRNRII